jgi:hypothetical protein
MSAALDRRALQRLSGRTLASVQRRWGALSEEQGAWLVKQGVPPEALLDPTPVGAANVCFHDDGTFAASASGTAVLTFRVADVDAVDIDLAAWSPRTGELASWYGRAFALGEDQIFNPASFFAGAALRIHEDPLAWLCAGREGICIIKPEVTYAMMRHVPRVTFADFDFAKTFETWIKPPAPRVAMFVETQGVEL